MGHSSVFKFCFCLILIFLVSACGKEIPENLGVERTALTPAELNELSEPCPSFAQNIANTVSEKNEPFRCLNIFVDSESGSEFSTGLDADNALQSPDLALLLSRSYLPNHRRLPEKTMVIIQIADRDGSFEAELEDSDQLVVFLLL